MLCCAHCTTERCVLCCAHCTTNGACCAVLCTTACCAVLCCAQLNGACCAVHTAQLTVRAVLCCAHCTTERCVLCSAVQCCAVHTLSVLTAWPKHAAATLHYTTHGVLLLVHTVVGFTCFCLMIYLTTPCLAPRL